MHEEPCSGDWRPRGGRLRRVHAAPLHRRANVRRLRLPPKLPPPGPRVPHLRRHHPALPRLPPPAPPEALLPLALAAAARLLRRPGGGPPPGAGDAHRGESDRQKAFPNEIQPKSEGKDAFLFDEIRVENAEMR